MSRHRIRANITKSCLEALLLKSITCICIFEQFCVYILAVLLLSTDYKFNNTLFRLHLKTHTQISCTVSQCGCLQEFMVVWPCHCWVGRCWILNNLFCYMS